MLHRVLSCIFWFESLLWLKKLLVQLIDMRISCWAWCDWTWMLLSWSDTYLVSFAIHVMLTEMVGPCIATGQPGTTQFLCWVSECWWQCLAACSVSWRSLPAVDKHRLLVSWFRSWQSLLHQGVIAVQQFWCARCWLFLSFCIKFMIRFFNTNFHFQIWKWFFLPRST